MNIVMKRALITYCSRTGITKRFALQIHMACKRNGLDATLVSIEEFNKDTLAGVDYLFLGCWTHGLIVLFQHPDKPWVDFARSLPDLDGKKIVLFTTYKVATGSMFRKMRQLIKCQPSGIVLELKSRDGTLSETNARLLKEIISN